MFYCWMSNVRVPDENGGHHRKFFGFYSLYGLQYEYRWFMCWLYDPECENLFRHLQHWNGFSPVCKRLCSVKWCLCLNAFGQSWHLYGRWPVCEIRAKRNEKRKYWIVSTVYIIRCIRWGHARSVHIQMHTKKRVSIISISHWPLITGQ